MKPKRLTTKSQRGDAHLLAVLVVVLILLAIGGIFWLSLRKQPTVSPVVSPPPAKTAPTETATEEELEPLPTLSNSDEIEAIENDLNATQLDGMNEDLGSIEEDLGNL